MSSFKYARPAYIKVLGVEMSWTCRCCGKENVWALNYMVKVSQGFVSCQYCKELTLVKINMTKTRKKDFPRRAPITYRKTRTFLDKRVKKTE
jgi:hypothetical protein